MELQKTFLDTLTANPHYFKFSAPADLFFIIKTVIILENWEFYTLLLIF